MIYDCIIIGAGAAGLFCGAAFPKKINGLILEKTKRPGTKLLMSGSGQCNITHDGSIKDFTAKYGKNGSKVRSCLYKYNNLELTAFLHQNGIPTITREDGKIFPESMDAHDVLHMLLENAGKNGFHLQTESAVSQITPLADADGGFHVNTENGETYRTKNLIIATGGCSYPSTGSDGSIFPVLRRDLGLKITPLHPCLSPVNVKDYPYTGLSGISFPSAQLIHWHDGKKAGETEGGLLFTHENLSGPLLINYSKYIRSGDKITLNYICPCSRSEAAERISRIASGIKGSAQNQLNALANALTKEFHLPKSFIAFVLSETGNKAKAIAGRLTEDEFEVESVAGYNKAMATTGGIALAELDGKTMAVKKYPGLYAIGEATDIDGDTGGYNLQFAYSSARAAGAAIAAGL